VQIMAWEARLQQLGSGEAPKDPTPRRAPQQGVLADTTNTPAPDAAAKSDVLYSSTLRRSIETAAAVAGARPVIQDPVFVEAPLPPPRIPGKRSPDAWGVWSRAAWWMGDSKEMESREAAELRAEAAVATLTARALRGETVMLLAHGWFNRMMRPVLRAQGWRCVRDGGDGYWSFRTYEKRS
jgi:broad specificity phosphatase PhoE